MRATGGRLLLTVMLLSKIAADGRCWGCKGSFEPFSGPPCSPRSKTTTVE